MTPTSVSSDGQNYSLSFASSLADGVYAVVARDAVLNVSDVNVRASIWKHRHCQGAFLLLIMISQPTR